ncbi:transposase [Sphingobacterium cavernae]|uniref:transposase n=1 Tax=Sphingobacterium cavernae TaxID=2592657 RepID=UPI00122FCEBC
MASQNRVSPGERNPIEGKFGQAKTGYGMNLILARLARTSETWISCIVLVLNLVKLAELALYCIINIIINYVVDLRKNGNLISQYSKIC